MRQGWRGFAKPTRLYWRAMALEHRPIFISLRGGAAIFAHDFEDFSPKPDGLVRETSFALNKNHTRREIIPFVHTA